MSRSWDPESDTQRYTVPEKNKLQKVYIRVGSVHHITNHSEAKSVVVIYGDIQKDWNQNAPCLLFAATDEYHIIKASPNYELAVLTDEKQASDLYEKLVKGQIVLALKSTEKKKHRIVVKESDRLSIIATPGHTYAVEVEGDVSSELYYALEYGNDLYIFPQKGRRYVVEVPVAKPSTANDRNYVAACYILIKSKPK